MLEAVKHTCEVNADDTVPLVRRDLVQRKTRLLETGVVKAPSMLPNWLTAFETIDSTLLSSLTSVRTKSDDLPESRISAAILSPAGLISAITTFAPTLDKCLAVVSPIPLAAPVTMMVRSCRITLILL